MTSAFPMTSDFTIVTDLFWTFFSIVTGILMLWVAIAFRHLRTGASRALLISAILDLPCSLLTTLYWNFGPMNSFFDSGVDEYPVIDQIESVVSNLSTLLFLIWLVSLLFVALRSKQEQLRVRELQHILEQKIAEDPASPDTTE